ncbi:RagB/SusD family nutrient uptake outer membrane protein [Aquimarina algiphila]|uniref:RagB/SusD family nutrient uptake outer membrane protein n=1 Tax=Aquimarina algiphila TaxID=2047982 RepID=UPI0023302713|nr:RagB/SusD family nutrient uptake outer membrane protein [Aquimarina algiphila]
MKNYKLKSYILILFITTIVVSSCDNYLEESPDDRLELNSVEKAAKVVADSYSQGSYAFTDMYTDLAGSLGVPDANGIVANSGGNTIRLKDLQIYTWDDVTAINQDTPNYFWNNTYEAIAHSNEVLAVIDNLEGDEKQKNAVKGEALISRAYNHFMLVNLFGLHYDENASTNLGVPYIVKPETEFLPTYKRNTVAEVYDFVEKDLLEGLALISDEFFIGTKKYHFTKKAAQAFASRYYLWKKDYANCIKYSDLFLGGNATAFVKNSADFTLSGGEALRKQYENPEEESNVFVIQKFSLYQRRNFGFRLNSNDVTILFRNPLSARDVRNNPFIFNGREVNFLPRLFEYFFRENLSSTTGLAYHIAVELKGEEVLLNRAEAKLMLNSDITGALDDLNIYIGKRYIGGALYTNADIPNIELFYNATNPEDGILQLLLDERKKEFWDHGLRWFDIKRYNLSVSHVLPISEGGNGRLTDPLILTENDLRKAVQIPEDAISLGLTPNPR